MEGSLPYLDVLVTRKTNGFLGRKVYRKLIPTNIYSNASSHHHQPQKRALIKSLFYRTERIYDEESLAGERTIEAGPQ